MNKMRFLGVMLISVSLLLGSMGTALAQEDVTPTPELISESTEADALYQGLFGTVEGMDDSIITLQTRAQLELLTIRLDGETIYRVPGQMEADVDDIVEGSRLAILAAEGEQEGEYTAIRVMVIPDKATRSHLTGVVVSIDEETKTMTITDADGETSEVEIPGGAQGGVVGDFISAAVRQNSDNGKPEVTGTQTAEQVRQRIQAHINQLDDDPEDQTEPQIQTMEQLRQMLTEKLEGLMEQHENTMQNVLQTHANEEAEGPIQEALDRMQQIREQISETIGNALDGDHGQPSQQDRPQNRGSED